MTLDYTNFLDQKPLSKEDSKKLRSLTRFYFENRPKQMSVLAKILNDINKPWWRIR